MAQMPNIGGGSKATGGDGFDVESNATIHTGRHCEKDDIAER